MIVLAALGVLALMTALSWLHTLISYEMEKAKELKLMIFALHFFVTAVTMILTKALI